MYLEVSVQRTGMFQKVLCLCHLQHPPVIVKTGLVQGTLAWQQHWHRQTHRALTFPPREAASTLPSSHRFQTPESSGQADPLSSSVGAKWSSRSPQSTVDLRVPSPELLGAPYSHLPEVVGISPRVRALWDWSCIVSTCTSFSSSMPVSSECPVNGLFTLKAQVGRTWTRL